MTGNFATGSSKSKRSHRPRGWLSHQAAQISQSQRAIDLRLSGQYLLKDLVVFDAGEFLVQSLIEEAELLVIEPHQM